MATRYGIFTEQRARQISDAVHSLKTRGTDISRHAETEHNYENWLFVKAKEDIAAASNPETGYTQGEAWVTAYTATDDLDRETITIPGESDIVVVNRTSVSIQADDYFWVRKVEAEYVPIISAGGAGKGAYGLGEIVNAECPAGSQCVLLTEASDCLINLPKVGKEYGDPYSCGIGEAQVFDPLGVLAGLSLQELIGATVRIEYVIPVNNCDINSGRWIMTAITGIQECE